MGKFGTGGGARKGSMAQRTLLEVLKNLIDEASAKGAGAARDIARDHLRDTLLDANWRTPYIWKNLGVRRCRYLASIGKSVPFEYLYTSEKDIARIEAHKEGRR